MGLTKVNDRGLDTPVDLLDDEKIRFGTGNDLEIYHNGTGSYLQDMGTGDLNVLGSKINIKNQGGTETMASFNTDLGVELYHNNVKKFETTSYGALVTGNTMYGDSDKVILGAGSDFNIFHDGTNSHVQNLTGNLKVHGANEIHLQHPSSGEMYIKCVNNAQVELYHNNALRLNTSSSGVDITGELYIPDSTNIKIGNNGDLKIYHDGSNSHIVDSGTGSLLIKGDAVHLGTAGGEYYLRSFEDGAISLRYDNSEKLATTSTGVNVTGQFGIGTTSPGSWDANADDFVINGNGHTGITINSGSAGTTNLGNIVFAEGTGGSADKFRGVIQYKHGDDYMRFYTNNEERLRIDSSGRVGIGTTSTDKNAHSLLNVHRSTSDGCYQYFTNSTTGTGGDDGFTIGIDSGENAMIWNRENTNIRFATNATEQMELQADGDLKLASGNIIIDTSGKGILFHPHSTPSNLLDDYEEGTHDYSIQGSGSNPSSESFDSNHRKMHYIKIGHICHLWGELRWSFSSGNFGSGQAKWTLPFTSAAETGTNSQAKGVCQFWNVNWKHGQSSADNIHVEIGENRTYMTVRRSQSNSTTENHLQLGTDTFQTSNSGLGVEMDFSITYKTA